MSDTVDACPECDSTDIYHRKPSVQGKIETDIAYRCTACKTDFEEPVERERRGHGAPTGGWASKLYNTDPDAVVPPSASED